MVAQMSSQGAQWEGAVDLVRGHRHFALPVCRVLLVSACSSALSPSVVPASSPGMQLPSVLLLPWSRGGNRGVPVWAHHDVRAEKGASGFSCSCLQKPLDDAYQSFWWCRCAGKQVPGNFGLAQAENQVRASSCTAPAAVPRMQSLIQQFYCVFLFLTL